MSNQQEERDRIRRIRERQLQARDPKAVYRKTQRVMSRRGRRRQKRITLREIYTDIPQKWRGLVLGVLFGALISIVLPLLWDAAAAELIGLASIVVLALLGFALGQAFEVRDELRDFSRRK